MKRAFIGGRVPKMVKEAFVQEAEAAGLTLTEHLEKVLLERMNQSNEGEESTPTTSVDDLRRMIQEELAAQIEPETITTEEEPPEDPEPERVGEEPDFELEEDDDFYPGNPELEGKPGDVLPYPVEEMLNLAVQQTWERTGDQYDFNKLNKGEVSSFLEDLALELQSLEEEDADGHFVEPYDKYLPDILTDELDQIISQVIPANTEDLEPEILLSLLTDGINQRADELFQEDRIIELVFDRADYWYLDKLLEKENASRGKKQQFSDFKGYLLFLIGERLVENGTGLWGVTDKGMVKLGGRMQKTILNK